MEKAIKNEVKNVTRRVEQMMVKESEKYEQTKKYADLFIDITLPLRILLIIFGQLPFKVRKSAKRPQVFTGKWYHWINFIYLLFFTFYLLMFLAITFGIITFFIPDMLEVEPVCITVRQESILLPSLGQKERLVKKLWEQELIRRNFSLMLVAYLWLAHLVSMNLGVMLNRRDFLNYMNYWLCSLQIMQMEVAKSVRHKFYAELFFALLFLGGIGAALIYNKGEFNEVVDIFSRLILRPADAVWRGYFGKSTFKIPNEVYESYSDNYDTPEARSLKYWFYKIPGILALVFAYLGARASTMHFVFYNRLLVCIASEWNQRLRDCLVQNTSTKDDTKDGKKGKGQDENKEPRPRLSLFLVLKDHFNIVQLYNMTADLFGFQLVVYYSMQTTSLVFLLYHMVSIHSPEKVYDTRLEDAGAAELTIKTRLGLQLTEDQLARGVTRFYVTLGVTVLASVYMFITTDAANAAYNESMAGFQVLRRNLYLGNCDTRSERNFVHSLIVSFAPNNPIEISASGYFTVNRSLIPAIMNNVLGYLVACYTLKVDDGSLWKSGMYENNEEKCKTPP